MALQLWLPLNGTLKNNGLSDVTVTNNGATVNTSGKTGSCYSFDGTDDYMSVPFTDFGNNFSVSLWFNRTSSSSVWIACSRNAAYGGLGIYVDGSSNKLTIDCMSAAVSSSRWATNTVISNGVWYHLTVVRNPQKIMYYINGEFGGEKQIAYSNTAGPILTICVRNTDGSNIAGYSGYKINDFRIYDHCLSQKEISELSKALILHYPLDGGSLGNPNMILDSYYSSTPWPTAITGTEVYKGKTAMKVKSATLYQNSANDGRNIFPSMTFEENTQYTISLDWCDHLRTDSDSTNLYIRFKYSDGTYTNIISPTANNDANWVHRTLTSTAGKNVVGIYTTYGHAGTVSIANLKIEKGTNETPWADGADATKMYDCSGYGRTGTVTGAPQLGSETPRYSRSTSFDGTSYISVPTSVKVKDEISLSVWAYLDNWTTYCDTNSTNGRFISCTQTGGWTILAENGVIKFYMGTGTSSNTYKTANASTTLANLSSGWHLFTGTYDGFSSKIYIDGVLDGSTTAYSTKTLIYYHSTNGVFIGAEAGTSATVPNATTKLFNGKLSDMRIYATALSASEILDLYNSPVYIDDSGTMGAFEFVENSENGQSIEKTGVVGVKNFIEPSNNLLLMPDGSVFLRLLRHKNPANKIFTEYNCWLNSSDTDLYSSLILLKNVSWMKNLSEYEFLACEKLTSSGTETQVRWKQTSNPATTSSATGFQLVSGTAQYLTAGLANAGTHGCFDVDDANKYWCCCGSYSTYQDGLPGFTGVVTTGYLELYIRIPDEILKGYVDSETKFFNQSIVSGKLKEI